MTAADNDPPPPSGGWWRKFRPFLWTVVVTIVVVMFIFVVIEPFSSPDAATTSNEVATEWNDGIARLGILPIYPPEEDIYVGDIWAVVADAEDLPLLGRGVRIAHIDLRGLMPTPEDGPVFSDTQAIKKDEEFRHVDPAEIDTKLTPKDRISLALVAFPGITIRHAVRATGFLGATLGRFGAGRDTSKVEELRIPVAETYGVSPISALLKLDDWCRDMKTSLYCTDQFVRRALAYGVTDQVLRTNKNQYTTKFQLRLITRVFLTLEIEERQVSDDSRGAAANVGEKEAPASDVPAVANHGVQTNDSSSQTTEAITQQEVAAREAADRGAANGGSGSAIGLSRVSGSGLELHQTFQRPVAFGYRAITISLDPSTPSKEGVP